MIKSDLKVKVLVSLDGVDDKKREISSYKFSSDRHDPDGYVEKDGTLNFTSLHDGIDVEFEVINNVRGRHFSFPKKGEDAVWLHEGGGCPAGPGEARGKVKIEKDENDPMKLILVDYNENEEEIGYMLRFEDLASSEIYQLDPVIKNGGGGGGS